MIGTVLAALALRGHHSLHGCGSKIGHQNGALINGNMD